MVVFYAVAALLLLYTIIILEALRDYARRTQHVAYFSISVEKIEMLFSFMTLYARIAVNVNRST